MRAPRQSELVRLPHPVAGPLRPGLYAAAAVHEIGLGWYGFVVRKEADKPTELVAICSHHHKTQLSAGICAASMRRGHELGAR